MQIEHPLRHVAGLKAATLSPAAAAVKQRNDQHVLRVVCHTGLLNHVYSTLSPQYEAETEKPLNDLMHWIDIDVELMQHKVRSCPPFQGGCQVNLYKGFAL